MELHKRLKLYRTALCHYWLSFFFPFLKKRLRTDRGFCKYFIVIKGVSPVSGAEEWCGYVMPTLFLELIGNHPSYDSAYWFKPGASWPRILWLYKAIARTKASMKVELDEAI